MLLMFIISILLTINIGAKEEIGEECLSWFKSLKIVDVNNCANICQIARVSMGTFHCIRYCKVLCGLKIHDSKQIYKLTYYAGLSIEEIKLITKYPKEALQVYTQKRRAEKATKKVFGENLSDDESDAFRHFVWGALVTKELGPDLAKQFLDAHESSLSYDNPAKAMDLANDFAGIVSAIRLKQKDELSEEAIINEAIKAIRERKLIVLKPRRGDK